MINAYTYLNWSLCSPLLTQSQVYNCGGRCLVCTKVSINLGPVIGTKCGVFRHSSSSLGSFLIFCHAALMLRLVRSCVWLYGIANVSRFCSLDVVLDLSVSSVILGILSALLICWLMSLRGYPLAMSICLSVVISCSRCF